MKHNILTTILVILALTVIGLVVYIALIPDQVVAPMVTEQKSSQQKTQQNVEQNNIEQKTIAQDKTVDTEITSKIDTPEQSVSITGVPSDWKKYTSKNHGFSFFYPTKLVLNTDASTDDDIIISDLDERSEVNWFGMWQYDVKVRPNVKRMTLHNVIESEQVVQVFIAQNPQSYTISDIKIGGVDAKYVSLQNAGYGNAFVFVIQDDNIVRIAGNDDTEELKTEFMTVLSSFVFEK